VTLELQCCSLDSFSKTSAATDARSFAQREYFSAMLASLTMLSSNLTASVAGKTSSPPHLLRQTLPGLFLKYSTHQQSSSAIITLFEETFLESEDIIEIATERAVGKALLDFIGV